MITMTEPSPSSTTTATRKPNLRGVSAIRAYFRRNTTPIYFVSPTPFNMTAGEGNKTTTPHGTEIWARP